MRAKTPTAAAMRARQPRHICRIDGSDNLLAGLQRNNLAASRTEQIQSVCPCAACGRGAVRARRVNGVGRARPADPCRGSTGAEEEGARLDVERARHPGPKPHFQGQRVTALVDAGLLRWVNACRSAREQDSIAGGRRDRRRLGGPVGRVLSWRSRRAPGEAVLAHL